MYEEENEYGKKEKREHETKGHEHSEKLVKNVMGNPKGPETILKRCMGKK